MNIITMEIRMEGDSQGCKELVAMELEEILRKIGWAQVRCTGVREEIPKQMRMGRD